MNTIDQLIRYVNTPAKFTRGGKFGGVFSGSGDTQAIYYTAICTTSAAAFNLDSFSAQLEASLAAQGWGTVIVTTPSTVGIVNKIDIQFQDYCSNSANSDYTRNIGPIQQIIEAFQYFSSVAVTFTGTSGCNGGNGGGVLGGNLGSGGNTYTVQSGDTLAKIANKFHTTIAAIAAANGITNVNSISVGQKLRINGASSGSTAPANAPATNTAALTTQEVLALINANKNAPSASTKKLSESFFDSATGKITTIGMITLGVLGIVLITSKK